MLTSLHAPLPNKSRHSLIVLIRPKKRAWRARAKEVQLWLTHLILLHGCSMPLHAARFLVAYAWEPCAQVGEVRAGGGSL